MTTAKQTTVQSYFVAMWRWLKGRATSDGSGCRLGGARRSITAGQAPYRVGSSDPADTVPVVAEGTNVALTSVEICTGAGGQALGLHKAGFVHRAVVEIDPHACATLRANHPEWNVLEQDLLAEWDASAYAGVDLLAGGVPCPPFSKAGRQLGADDERDLFPRALDLAEVLQPKAVMLENVRGLLDPVFAEYREGVNQRLRDLGYEPSWRLLNASDYGVPQLRPRVILVAIRKGLREFEWPEPQKEPALTVGEALKDLMAANGWEGADRWAQRANTVAPTSLEGPRSMEGQTSAQHAHGKPGLPSASTARPSRRSHPNLATWGGCQG